MTTKHGLIGLASRFKEGAKRGVRQRICQTAPPLVDTTEQAVALGLTEQQVIKNVMLKDTVDGEFTTVEDVAEAAVFFAGFNSNALTGQSLIVSHGWSMQ
jgi:3-hydroxybutyrate dehydrogenase